MGLLRTKDQGGLRGASRPGIAAYGFDVLGFKTPGSPQSIPGGGFLYFVGFNAVGTNLEDFDGLIIPQGIFESIEPRRTMYRQTNEVHWHEGLLLDRERQVLNMVSQGKWLCFLVGAIIDRVPQEHFRELDIRHADLCKRMLNSFSVHRYLVEGDAAVQATQSEFEGFIKQFGIAKTVFQVRGNGELAHRVLAKVGQNIVGVEFQNKVFFLPFHSTRRDEQTILEVAGGLVRAVSDYRQKHSVPMPEWLDEFEFASEESLANDLRSANEKTAKLRSELQGWKEYKAILTTSGDILREKIIAILEKFFGLKVDPIDEGREDGKILDADLRILAIFEVKGIKVGVGRNQINQVDSHREGNGMLATTPGILFINNQMDVSGIKERVETIIAQEQIAHAVRNGVTIVRTIDLIFLMKHLEAKGVGARGAELLRLFNTGGGWLKAGPGRYELVQT